MCTFHHASDNCHKGWECRTLATITINLIEGGALHNLTLKVSEVAPPFFQIDDKFGVGWFLVRSLGLFLHVIENCSFGTVGIHLCRTSLINMTLKEMLWVKHCLWPFVQDVNASFCDSHIQIFSSTTSRKNDKKCKQYFLSLSHQYEWRVGQINSPLALSIPFLVIPEVSHNCVSHAGSFC